MATPGNILSVAKTTTGVTAVTARASIIKHVLVIHNGSAVAGNDAAFDFLDPVYGTVLHSVRLPLPATSGTFAVIAQTLGVYAKNGFNITDIVAGYSAIKAFPDGQATLSVVYEILK